MLNRQKTSIERDFFQLANTFFNSLCFKKLNYFVVIKHFKLFFKTLDPDPEDP